MKFKSYDDIQKYLVLNKTDLMIKIDSFNDVSLLEIFNNEQITDLIEIFSHKIFLSNEENFFLTTKKFGRRFELYNLWKFLKKDDSINSDKSFGMLDQYGNYNLESEELIMGKTFKEISDALLKELNNKLTQIKLLSEKAKNFRETEYFESNEQRSSRESEENNIDHLIDEISKNYEQTGIFETNEERYHREVGN